MELADQSTGAPSGGGAKDAPAGGESQASRPAPSRAGAASAGGSGPGGGGGGRGPGGGRGGPGGGRGGRGGPGGGRGRGRGGPGGRDGRGRGRDRDDPDGPQEEQRVVKINRCATVVKGGRRFSFSALVVVGDAEGSVGFGFGKANEVPPSVEKAFKDARKNKVKIALKGHTIPHQVVGRFLSSKVVLVPAAEGTGVIAGASVRAVVECAGVKNVLTKVYGSTNPLNVVKATMDGLKKLRTAEQVSRLRGVEVAS